RRVNSGPGQAAGGAPNLFTIQNYTCGAGGGGGNGQGGQGMCVALLAPLALLISLEQLAPDEPRPAHCGAPPARVASSTTPPPHRAAMKITRIETHVCHARMRNWVFVKVLTDQDS